MVDPLTRSERRFLRRARSRSLATILLGCALVVGGGLYGVWGARQTDPERAPDPADAWDRPIARLASLPGRSTQGLRETEPTTALERQLLDRLEQSDDTIARLMVALLRVLVSGFVLTVGLIFLVAGATSRRFAGIVKKLEPPLPDA